MPPYRERFGFKGGEFPVAERVAERSLALPFFGSMTEEQVDGSARRSRGALRRRTPRLAAMSRFAEEQDPLFRRINSSISFDRRLAPFDVEQSRAHARALSALGVLDDDELKQLLDGLDTVAAELERRQLRGPATTTRTSTWRSSAG